ncbi:helix-turn-helix domain-containing protein [Micromonospora sp. NPDC003816]|uniref:helix-turn-helix domain-containing protein n=1 Tax=Micromonospora sp. NPDC003816 TaxID=3364224 RepID=UPI00368AACBE
MHVTQGADRGVAYDFWWRVRTEQDSRGWTDDELKARTGIARTTVDRLRAGKRPPTARVVNALADALGINMSEAHQLAGRTPPAPENSDEPAGRTAADAREAILRDPIYNDEQREAMLRLHDLFARTNRQD